MNKSIEPLTLNSGAIKDRSSNNYKKSNRESFQSVFNKAMMDKDEKTSTDKSDTSERINISDVCDIEILDQCYEDQLEYKSDMAIERLAAFFGIGKELMKAVLKSLHINPEDLVDPSQKDEIIKAIIKKFGLSKDRAEALSELINEL